MVSAGVNWSTCGMKTEAPLVIRANAWTRCLFAMRKGRHIVH